MPWEQETLRIELLRQRRGHQVSFRGVDVLARHFHALRLRLVDVVNRQRAVDPHPQLHVQVRTGHLVGGQHRVDGGEQEDRCKQQEDDAGKDCKTLEHLKDERELVAAAVDLLVLPPGFLVEQILP